MHLILTHEQADFDALASLLGACLVEEQALAVLPHKVNRNGRAYLTLYGLELPFIEARDLPRERVESVTLVDTQSLKTVRGIDDDTKIYVIDHHDKRADLPANWQVTSDPVGANTTIFVEMLQARNLQLSVPQSTLLLLGIYEDTGGLTYTRTTTRDVLAVAHLLDQGASLQVAQEFLNHPLSHIQQKIYDALLENAETHQLHGYHVIVSRANAQHTDEDLSIIVHKLRDLLDPDALIVLIETGGGVQMIARGTTDQIDVGALMTVFGGGGHPRAAAALVRVDRAEHVYADLMEALPAHVRPAVTVGEIMSRGPQTLKPETRVKEAEQQMRLYGYEGYPVVEEGQVLGLLTRRAVDRTISHKLNLKAKDVMDAGSYTIYPDETLDVLRQVMTNSSWGQIPVVSREEDEIIGIVTRTDLIKTMTPHAAPNSRHNLASKMESALPGARLALLKLVAEEVRSQHMALYIVGGFVRDLLLGRSSMDVDLVVEGDAIALGQSLVEQFQGKVTTHERFGTAKWQIDGVREQLAETLAKRYELEINPADFPADLDLVSARREFYTHPTALPTVERGSIKLDLHRRDFPLNTLALRLDGRYYGELHDYWGGLDDLEQGVIRVLHSLSFVDDPTRILRAVRYEQRYGFEIEARTADLIKSATRLLGRVSGDRIRHEISYMLREENGLQMLARLAALGVYQVLDENWHWDEATMARIKYAGEAEPAAMWNLPEEAKASPLQVALSYLAWLIVLPGVPAAAVAGRLKLPKWLTKAILAGSRFLPEVHTLTQLRPGEVTAKLDQMPILAVYGLWLVSESDEVCEVLHTYAEKWRHIHPKTTGHDLRKMNVPPGPHYRHILDGLRSAWLDGEISTDAQEQALLIQLVAETAG